MSQDVDRADALIPCPDCHGDGHFIYVGGPGYFSPSFGNYLPTEKVITCDRCGGTGTVELEESGYGSAQDG
jgi:DnaJ-class molecular chaperone